MKPKLMAVPTRFGLAIFCVTGRRDNHYTTEPIWLRRMDLNQRPLGYEPNELPSCSTPRYYNKRWRRKRDSNPRAVADLPVFKTGPFNQTWVFLHIKYLTTNRLYHKIFNKVNKINKIYAFLHTYIYII